MNKLLVFLFLVIPFSAKADIGIRLEPVTTLLGAINLTLDVGVNDKIRVSPQLIVWDVKGEDGDGNDFSIDLQGYGLESTYHLNGVFSDGWYFGGYFTTFSLEFENDDTNEQGSLDASVIGALAAYQWCWDVFYMNLGIKVGTFIGESKIEVEDSNGNKTGDEEDFPQNATSLDFKLGWYF